MKWRKLARLMRQRGWEAKSWQTTAFRPGSWCFCVMELHLGEGLARRVAFGFGRTRRLARRACVAILWHRMKGRRP